ncbi:ImmA/IrrE family metallo-endopeptidase [Xanthomonas hortorum]|uniref:ImmA/IrrE family metallo-endopeptidase n=1 Tax=Xanthomonas hortorum TaxID=56454 RepID=UPI001F309B1E|nr:ImmA/IrrE family metallo-endopeptidase [Xanthomonas hortorum]MCE4364796.1 ImmA/IrrE family metallo-endopeptidase [Xanthomonas hortorum]
MSTEPWAYHLRLEDVRALLRLDLSFYTATDPGLAREVISRIRVAGIQIFERPTLLFDAIKKMSLQALYLPDSKKIMLDGSLPVLKHRWNEAHEVGHSLLPWHEGLMHGDNNLTLSQHCHEQVEAEANYAAGRLLFLRDRFDEEARSVEASIMSIKPLKERYGNTLSSTLYRFVESVGQERAVLGVICGHPHERKRARDFDIQFPCRHVILSPAFRDRFGDVDEVDLFLKIASYCGAQGGGPLGQSEIVLIDVNGKAQRFMFETFFNRYDALTLAVHLGEVPIIIPVGF